ncbi:hypothetical protein D3C81_168570 [compost metagenome]|uniref:Uncharacterized protein n=1 Tax=Paenibacillus stellifer TaxID=169760 RepID=A0A089LT28_9BACL|nr:hypothetical protein PSTEL_14115 [Paenibacillus stellifer]
MSYQPVQSTQMGKVLYQADGPSVQNVKAIRSNLHQLCRQYSNRIVRIETIDGQIFVGRIVSCERGLLHLAVRNPSGHRAFFGMPYSNDELILTLVLYELLVITLLST